MPSGVQLHGAAELESAFRQLDRDVRKGLVPAIRLAAQRVKDDAQGRAGFEIRNIGSRWQRMRIGVTAKSVYVAPASRRRGGSPRPNLAGLLMDRAMAPALNENGEAAVAALRELVDVAAARAGF